MDLCQVFRHIFWKDYNLNIKGLEDSLKNKTLSSNLTEDIIINFVTKNMCDFPILTKTPNVFLNNSYIVSLTNNDIASRSKDISLSELTRSEISNSTDSIVNSVAESEAKNIITNVGNFLDTTAATVTTLDLSFTEGVGKFLEGLVDAAVITKTAILSIRTGTVDLIFRLLILMKYGNRLMHLFLKNM